MIKTQLEDLPTEVVYASANTLRKQGYVDCAACGEKTRKGDIIIVRARYEEYLLKNGMKKLHGFCSKKCFSTALLGENSLTRDKIILETRTEIKPEFKQVCQKSCEDKLLDNIENYFDE